MTTFIREISMQPDDERRLAVRPAHREYVQQLFEAGQIRMSGPLAGDDGAVLVYEAADRAAAEALVAADPYRIEDVVTELSLREWNVIFPTT